MKQQLSILYRWLRPIIDPLRMWAGLRQYGGYLHDWRTYRRLPHVAPLICKLFSSLNLVEFSGVDDQGHFIEAIPPTTFVNQTYACGMYHFRQHPV